MIDHVDNRNNSILKALRAELFGPAPAGKDLDCVSVVNFENKDASYGPWKQIVTGEEILDRGRPTKRYGVGVLYPIRRPSLAKEEVQDENAEVDSENIIDDSAPTDLHLEQHLSEKALADIEKIDKKIGTGYDDGASDDFDLSSANSLKPSSMGISFMVDLSKGSIVHVVVEGGRYSKFKVNVQGQKPRVWWKRSKVKLDFKFECSSFLKEKKRHRFYEPKTDHHNDGNLDVKCEIFSRPVAGESESVRLITVCVINRKEGVDKNIDEFCLFQTYFEASVEKDDTKLSCVMPYPKVLAENMSEEEQSLELLYRNVQTYGVGHGCAADWTNIENSRVSTMIANAFPSFEVPRITADISVEVPIAPLAGLIPGDDGEKSINGLIESYDAWIKAKRDEVASLPVHLKSIGKQHIDECQRVIDRMKSGKKFLDSNPKAKRAFQLANHAILIQQVRSDKALRKISFNEKTSDVIFSPKYEPINNILDHLGRRGKWRAFQIAFLLMSVESSVKGNDKDRKTVELIWFPTGGGKTEAYLGLAAYGMFFRRLEDSTDAGVHVLMRYTLRLLTAQQFQRASGLICAMEYIRKSSSDLGDVPFSIGLWLGGEVTPNNRADAKQKLKKINEKSYANNPFILDRCPWCKGQLGLIDSKVSKKKFPRVMGYEVDGPTVVYKCNDVDCEFSVGNLPIFAIDEDIYEVRPTMLIGTVDKFATLAWKPQARNLFGLNEDGTRVFSPPGIIIQDELHLIAGPLGSMVGLYEVLVEELCTDRRFNPPVPPKIISSTATIRQYEEQIKALYNRSEVTLFPPPGLEEGDSFFSQYAMDKNGKRAPGKIYVGVFAPSLGSTQTTQVRTFSALMQAPQFLAEDKAKDPWWSLMLFFNSLRELGTTLSLFQSDIPDYLKILCNRYGIAPLNRRKLYNIMELTGRLRSDEVPVAISKLEVLKEHGAYPVDACLASNIIEVGIDIDRLSLLSVVGQPKTTSQYIQVTGRVGRNSQKPGLVVTLYGVSKPRDRSHFEKFRSYHEKLYAQVEPTSATPFSPPVLDRALHGLMAAYARQVGNNEIAESPYPFPEKLIEQLKNILVPRIEAIDKAEIHNFLEVFNFKKQEWKNWGRDVWRKTKPEHRPLLRYAGSYVPADSREKSWPTPSSLRNVDAECEAHVTDLYATVEGI